MILQLKPGMKRDQYMIINSQSNADSGTISTDSHSSRGFMPVVLSILAKNPYKAH